MWKLVFILGIFILGGCTVIVQPVANSYDVIGSSAIELYGVSVNIPQRVTIDATCTNNLYLEGTVYLTRDPKNVFLYMLNGDSFTSLTVYCSFEAVNYFTGRYVRLHY